VALGDSITDGAGTTPDTSRRWADELARLLGGRVGVANAGITGDDRHESSLCFGLNAIARLEMDALARAGARDAVLLEGINDITHPDTPEPRFPCLTKMPRYGWRAEIYDYADGRLVASRTTRREAPPTGWQHRRSAGRQTARLELEHSGPTYFEHDADGLLAITTAHGTHYRRRPSGAITRAAKLVRDELPDRIAAWAARNAPAEELYCLAIGYADFYNDPLPPSLGLGTVAELRAWRESHTTQLTELAFNPAEFACHDVEPRELDSPELADAYQALNQHWRSGDGDAAPRRLLTAIARTLAARDWSRLPVSPVGFAIVAVNMELGNFERDIKATIPAKLRRALLDRSPFRACRVPRPARLLPGSL
jgi:hypothetical protein